MASLGIHRNIKVRKPKRLHVLLDQNPLAYFLQRVANLSLQRVAYLSESLYGPLHCGHRVICFRPLRRMYVFLLDTYQQSINSSCPCKSAKSNINKTSISVFPYTEQTCTYMMCIWKYAARHTYMPCQYASVSNVSAKLEPRVTHHTSTGT